MKSSDNTLLLAGLFVLIVVIIALIVYYTRPGETKTSEQTSNTTELTVENLTFERTLNPDPSVGDGVSGYTIEPYGVEYAGTADYNELSKNVTFTMKWSNAPGFNNVVKGFKIEHYVDATKKHTYTYNSLITTETTDNNGELISFSDFGQCTVKLTSAAWDPKGSVVGQNKFKLFALVGTGGNTDSILYDGTVGTGTPATFPPALKISETQLSVTLSMTTPQTVEFKPEKAEGTSTRAVISKTIYDISNEWTTLTRNNIGIYLETVEGSNNLKFYLQYEDGKYLLLSTDGDLSKGSPTTTKPKLKVEIVNRKTGTSIGEIKKEGEDIYLSSLKSGGTLGLYKTNDQNLNEDIFKGFKWTFNERISKSLVPNGEGYFKEKDKNGEFGHVVCVSGDDAFVGQPKESKGGKVHIYRREGGVWKFKKSIDTNMIGLDPTDGTEFGCSIAISGDYAVIGQRKFTRGGSKQIGRAYVIKKGSNGDWITNKESESNKPIYLELAAASPEYNGAHYGTSVAISGKFVTVGAPGSSLADGTSKYDYGKYYKGAAYLYKIPNTKGNSIQLEGRGKVIGKNSSELFGYAVDISGDRVIVGAPYRGGVAPDKFCDISSNERAHCPNENVDKNPGQTGSVSIYKMGRNAQNKEQLVLEREMNPSGQAKGYSRFGESVAIDGMIAVIGETGRRGSATVTPPFEEEDQSKNMNVGSVYVLKGNGDRKTSSGKAVVRWDLMFSENIYDGADVVPAIPNARKNGNFGKSVSISGDTICIGQPGGVSGDVFVYKYKLVNTDTYYYGKKNAGENEPRKESRIKLDLVRTIKSPTNTSGGEFGKSVSNSGGYVMIGGPNAVGGGSERSGTAFITAI